MNMRRLDLEQDTENEGRWFGIRNRALGCKTPSALCIDIDETTINSVPQWYRTFSLILKQSGIVPPSYEEVCRAGGTDGIYPQLLGDTYEDIKAGLMRSRGINYALALTEPHVPRIQDELVQSNAVTLLGYITARPAHPHARIATEDKLFTNLRLPKVPVFMRPEDIAVRETTQWKIKHLNKMALLRPEVLFMILDDSANLAQGIVEHNAQRTHALPLIHIVYPGPLTVPKIADGRIKPQPENGIYFSDWINLHATLQDIHHDWLPRR